MTTDIDRAEVFSRPAARFDDDGNIEVRASAALGCRRALWYSATGYQPTNPPSEESMTAMEAGNALEPVVVRAMERAGWKVDPADPRDPQQVAVRAGPNLLVTGHPDGTVRMPIEEDEAPVPQLFLFDGEPPAPAYGDPMVVEIKTRGPEAFKRWRTLGAERSHPASVAQAAFYSLGEFGDLRDAVIATMDTGGRTWDWEVIPAKRLERALQDACEWLGELAAHHVQSGPDTDALPDRDFSATSWQCRSCPFLAVCLPGAVEVGEEAEIEGENVSDQEAMDAVAAYAEAQESIKEPEKAKRTALATLKAWMRRQGDSKATVGSRTVTLVNSTRYSVNYRRLNDLLDPEVRAEVVTESESEYKVELLGRVGIDPEMQYTPGGTAVTKLRLATDRYRKDAENETDWHDVVVWGPTAEAVNEYVGKGQRVYVAGRLVQNSWENDDGQRRHRTEVHASEVVFLDSRTGNGNGGDGQADDASPF